MRELLNPYHPETIPTSKEEFFGRHEIITWIEQQFIAGRRILMLHGPRQIGKSSFLHFLPRMMVMKHVYIPFSFAEVTDASVRAYLLYLLQTLAKQLVQQGVIQSERVIATVDSLTAIEQLLGQVQRQYPDYGILFLIDDFDRLWSLNSEKLNSFLEICQSLLASQPQLRFILTVQETNLSQLRHPILDAAPTHQLTALPPNDALQMVTVPVEGIIRFDYGVPKRIADLCSNHPYYLTLVNHVLFTRYAREGWVNLRHLDETIAAVLDMNIPSFDETWQRATWIERAVMMALASIRGSHGVFNRQDIISLLTRLDRQADERVIINALESLTSQGTLIKMGALSYKFFVDLYRHWLQSNFELTDILKEVIWQNPNARPEPVISIEEESDGPVTARSAKLPSWPVWIWGLIGLVLLGVVITGFFVMQSWLSNSVGSQIDPSTGSEVVQFSAGTPAGAAQASGPMPTPTPTVPIVVAKTLPSIAYMTRGQDESWRIQLMNTDGSDRINLSDRQEDETTPVWSPGADRLAFVSQRDGNREIYITDLSGSNVVNFSNNLADDWTPAWSPDGKQIAFSSNRSGNWEIYIANVDGSDVQQITQAEGGNISPVWSPDGTQLAFSTKRDGNWEIYTMRIDGTDLRRLTSNEVSDLAPVWSSAGDRIAFETNIDGNVEIYIMSASGGNPQNISNAALADDHGPVWSPDDQRIVFYSNREGNWDLFSINLATGNVTNLTNTPDTDEQTPAWRP